MPLFKLEYFLGALLILLAACGSPRAQEEGLPIGSTVTVSAASRTVTVDVKNAPFKAVLEELGRQVQMTVSVPDEFKSEPLSLSFQDLPLEEALKRLLGERLYTLLYNQDRGQQVIVGVQLFVKREPVPPADSASVNSAQTMAQLLTSRGVPAALVLSGLWGEGESLSNKGQVASINEGLPFDDLKRAFSETQDPALRSAILDAMANRGEEGPVAPALSIALSDSDEEVRTDALNHLKMTSEPLPLGPLAQMAATDSNPDLRMEAMTLMGDQLLAEDRTKEEWAVAQASLSRSLSDPNEDIREHAEMLLSDLSQSAQVPSR